MKHYRLSEDAIYVHAEIHYMNDMLKSSLDWNDQNLLEFHKREAKRLFENNDYHRAEQLMIWMWIEEFKEELTKGYTSPRLIIQGGGDPGIIFRKISREDLYEQHQHIERMMRDHFYISDLDVFIEQKFFEEDVDEKFWITVESAFGFEETIPAPREEGELNIFNEKAITDNKEGIMELFDDDAKRELIEGLKDDIQEVHQTIVKKVLSFWGLI